jgi:hypothetical protein
MYQYDKFVKYGFTSNEIYINVISSTAHLSGIRTHNVSGERH